MFETPILILVYNRTKYLKTLLKRLKKIKAKKIYVSFDGPKNNEKDKIKCREVDKIINKINWKCKVYKNYLLKNNGCKNGVSKGLDWFFSKVERGIILEDDCIPNKDFFTFSSWALEKYKNEKKIAGITGNNFLNNNIKIKESFYLSKYAHCWGWATWKRTWKKYDKNIKFWQKYKLTDSWRTLFVNTLEKKYWEKIYNNVNKNLLDSWAYPWMLCIWKSQQMIITPNKNLVLNIGFNRDATHTNSSFHSYSYKTSKIKRPYKSPHKLEINNNADNYVFFNHYKGRNYLWPYRFVYLINFMLSDPKSFFKKFFKLF